MTVLKLGQHLEYTSTNSANKFYSKSTKKGKKKKNEKKNEIYHRFGY